MLLVVGGRGSATLAGGKFSVGFEDAAASPVRGEESGVLSATPGTGGTISEMSVLEDPTIAAVLIGGVLAIVDSTAEVARSLPRRRRRRPAWHRRARGDVGAVPGTRVEAAPGPSGMKLRFPPPHLLPSGARAAAARGLGVRDARARGGRAARERGGVRGTRLGGEGRGRVRLLERHHTGYGRVARLTLRNNMLRMKFGTFAWVKAAS